MMAGGVSIAFDEESLSRVGQPFPGDPISMPIFFYSDIMYKDAIHKSFVKQNVKWLMNEIKTITKEYQTEEYKSQSMRVFNQLFVHLFKYSALMKNEFFSEEQEWRIGYFDSVADKKIETQTKKWKQLGDDFYLSPLSYFEKNNILVPYYDLKFDGSIIKEVMLGPKNNNTKKVVEIFLEKHNINCSVRISTGTYR